MEKPNNYEQTQAAGEFTPIQIGGHYLIIKQVEEMTSKTGKPMLKISFDTADNDKQPHYFADKFRNDIRPDKKWPGNGVVHMLSEDDDGKCSKNFKGFTTSAEKSNPGFAIQWGNGFCNCLKNKLIGGVFREEIGVYNGKETHQRKLAWFCSNDKVESASVPNPIETKEYKSWKESGGLTTAQADVNGWMNVPTESESELPFN